MEKFALLCDNSPSALILPGAFSSFMESSEDWYHHFEMATFASNTALSGIADSNIASGIVSGSDPVSYTDIANESFAVFCRCKGGIPFSSVTELVLLELAFELIRKPESGYPVHLEMQSE